jgi:hypothetical protein
MARLKARFKEGQLTVDFRVRHRAPLLGDHNQFLPSSERAGLSDQDRLGLTVRDELAHIGGRDVRHTAAAEERREVLLDASFGDLQ